MGWWKNRKLTVCLLTSSATACSLLKQRWRGPVHGGGPGFHVYVPVIEAWPRAMSAQGSWAQTAVPSRIKVGSPTTDNNLIKSTSLLNFPMIEYALSRALKRLECIFTGFRVLMSTMKSQSLSPKLLRNPKTEQRLRFSEISFLQ